MSREYKEELTLWNCRLLSLTMNRTAVVTSNQASGSSDIAALTACSTLAAVSSSSSLSSSARVHPQDCSDDMHRDILQPFLAPSLASHSASNRGLSKPTGHVALCQDGFSTCGRLSLHTW